VRQARPQPCRCGCPGCYQSMPLCLGSSQRLQRPREGVLTLEACVNGFGNAPLAYCLPNTDVWDPSLCQSHALPMGTLLGRGQGRFVALKLHLYPS
jgi:hypothetical protein